MIIKNGNVLDESFKFVNTDIKIERDIITEFGKFNGGDKIIDASGCFVVPGFIDTHIHGAYGVESVNATDEELTVMAKYLAQNGITTFAPTVRTLAVEDMLKAVEALSGYRGDSYAKIGGIHLEGPFVAPKGSLLRQYMLAPSAEIMKRFIAAGRGLVKIITLAPELEGAGEVIECAVANGVKVALGHTDADYETAKHAHALGASVMTHTFNAIRAFNHRDPGALGYGLTEEMTCELICDLIHLHPAAVKLVFAAKGDGRINMISDSSLVAGLPDGEYELDGRTRYVKNGKVTLKDGTISGSSKNLLDGVQNVVSIGIPLESAVKTASINPAKTLGIDNQTGSIAKGKKADIVILDKDLSVKQVLINGAVV